MEIIVESRIDNFMEYDFTEDWDVDKREMLEEYQKLGIWEKYFTYKMANTKEQPNYEVYCKANQFWRDVRDKYSEPKGRGRRYYLTDPDTHSKVLQELYGMLWKEDTLSYCRDDEKVIHGDTMNSIQTTLSWYVRICYEGYEKYYAGPAGNGFVKNKKGEKYQGSISQALQIFQCEKENFLKVQNKNIRVKTLEEFIKYNHTFGNFIPVPFQSNGGSFNVPRAGTTNDFWDLTLYRLYCWYENNKNMHEVETCDCEKNKDLCDLLGKNCQNVKLCIQWLKTFGSWDKFVEENFLTNYVVVKSENKYGIPKPLWCNEEKYEFKKLKECEAKKLWKKRVIDNKCKTIDACEQYFKNATECIKKRTESMIEKLGKE